MGHLKALGIKWIFTTIILLSLLAIFDSISISQILMMSIVVTGIAYIIGDLILLPVFGNLIATIADFGLAFTSIWLLSSLYIGQVGPIVLIAVAAAYFFAFCETIFHIYMKEKVLSIKQADIIPFPKPNMRLQTEFSKEIYPDSEKKKKD